MQGDFYELLGVSNHATIKEIEQAFAKKGQPLFGSGSLADQARFRELALAYETLRDPETWKEYDRENITPDERTLREAQLKIDRYGMLFGGETGWGRPQGSHEPIFYFFVAKRDENIAKAAIDKMYAGKEKEYGLTFQDVTVDGKDFLAIGFVSHHVGMEIARFQEYSEMLPGILSTQGRRESCLAAFFAEEKVRFAGVERRSKFVPTLKKVQSTVENIDKAMLLFSSRVPAFVNVTVDDGCNVHIKEIINAKASVIIDWLRNSGLKADQDFQINETTTGSFKKKEIVIISRAFERHSDLPELMQYAADNLIKAAVASKEARNM